MTMKRLLLAILLMVLTSGCCVPGGCGPIGCGPVGCYSGLGPVQPIDPFFWIQEGGHGGPIEVDPFGWVGL